MSYYSYSSLLVFLYQELDTFTSCACLEKLTCLFWHAYTNKLCISEISAALKPQKACWKSAQSLWPTENTPWLIINEVIRDNHGPQVTPIAATGTGNNGEGGGGGVPQETASAELQKFIPLLGKKKKKKHAGIPKHNMQWKLFSSGHIVYPADSSQLNSHLQLLIPVSCLFKSLAADRGCTFKLWCHDLASDVQMGKQTKKQKHCQHNSNLHGETPVDF